VVANHPQIARKFVAGKSYQGRDIVGVKISDNVATDESEPEVLYIANIHARERLTNEQALYLIGVLTKEYNSDSRITSLVNDREFWIIPITNPDGQVYDMTSDTSSGRSCGQQQIKIFLDIHSYGGLVLWPFGYTYSDTVAGAMSADEAATHRTIGQQLAQSNGYTPQQSSDLYITDGTSDDWTWGDQRIFSFTFELAGGSFYPSPGNIETLTQRNRDALLTLGEYADCPYRAIGKQSQYCA
jgi:hypothetical protein